MTIYVIIWCYKISKMTSLGKKHASNCFIKRIQRQQHLDGNTTMDGSSILYFT